MSESEPRDIVKPKPRRASRPKVKTACNNCKLRRVKCDETRPQCTKCVQSGRACGGFPGARNRFNTNDEVSGKPQHVFGSNVLTPASSRLQSNIDPINENEDTIVSPSSSTLEAPILQTVKAPSPISLLSNQCLKTFHGLVRVSPSSLLDFDIDTAKETIDDARARFKAWGTNIAAFRDGKSRTSLDFRLSDAPGIRNTILQVLKDLKEYLNESQLIISGKKSNQIWNLDDSSDSSVYSDDEANEDVTEGGMPRDNRVISSLDEQMKGIVASNASLMKLSIIIRSSATRDDYLKAASRYNTWDPYPDVGHVREKYGRAKHSSPWLIERLGKAITKRRQFLRYRGDHNNKMTGLDDVDEANREKPEKTVMVSTKATTFFGENAIQNIRAPVSDGGNSWVSQTSYEATTFPPDDSPRTLTVPSPPKFAFPDIAFEYGEPFQCPYCFTEQAVKNKAAWKKHVFQDLKPYICTFEECEMMFPSRNAWFLHEIQNHRREWLCQFCQHPALASASAFSTHMKTVHGNILANSSLKALILQSEEPVNKIPLTACPLCDELEASVHRTSEQLDSTSGEGAYGNLKVFRRHLGRHMEQLALFALPSQDTEQLDDESAEENDIPQNYDEEQRAELDSSDDDAEAESEVPHYHIQESTGDETSHEASNRTPTQITNEARARLKKLTESLEELLVKTSPTGKKGPREREKENIDVVVKLSEDIEKTSLEVPSAQGTFGSFANDSTSRGVAGPSATVSAGILNQQGKQTESGRSPPISNLPKSELASPLRNPGIEKAIDEWFRADLQLEESKKSEAIFKAENIATKNPFSREREKQAIRDEIARGAESRELRRLRRIKGLVQNDKQIYDSNTNQFATGEFKSLRDEESWDHYNEGRSSDMWAHYDVPYERGSVTIDPNEEGGSEELQDPGGHDGNPSSVLDTLPTLFNQPLLTPNRSHGPLSGPARERARMMRKIGACERCRVKKIACNEKSPCTNCEKVNAKCFRTDQSSVNYNIPAMANGIKYNTADSTRTSAHEEKDIDRSSMPLTAGNLKPQGVQGDMKNESSPSETTSISPLETSNSMDQELVCEHPGCGKIFHDHNKLKWHKRSHVPSYPCFDPFCLSRGIAFSLREDLVRHQQATHDGQRFYCEYFGCNYAVGGPRGGFSRKDRLAGHIAHAHPLVGNEDEVVTMKVTGNSPVAVSDQNVPAQDDLGPKAIEEQVRLIQQQNAMAFGQNSQFQPQTQQPQQQYIGVSVQQSTQKQYQGVFPVPSKKSLEGEDLEFRR